MKSRQRQSPKTLLSIVRHCAIVLLPTVVFCVGVGLGWISLSEVWRPQDSAVGHALCLWVLASLMTHYLVSVFGMLRFGSPLEQNSENIARLRSDGWNDDKRLVFCFVSQGVQRQS